MRRISPMANSSHSNLFLSANKLRLMAAEKLHKQLSQRPPRDSRSEMRDNMVWFGDMQVSMVVVWLILFAIFLICELITLGLTTIWFAGGSLGGMVTAICGGSITLQIVVALALSIILLVALRPFAAKYVNKNHVKTNVDSLIGQVAKVTKDIDNFNNQGQVLLKGMEWTARNVEDDVIKEGTMVTVEQVAGVKVLVRKK